MYIVYRNEFLEVVSILEQNDWEGLDENGSPVIWNDWNLENCSRQELYGWSHSDHCSYEERQEIMAGDVSLMHVYFKTPYLREYTKEQNYGPVDVIAAFGGIAGLCIGFSLLSLAEIIYFFSIRLIINKCGQNTTKT